MPNAKLPTTPKGWLVALLASFVGFVSGFATLVLAGRLVG